MIHFITALWLYDISLDYFYCLYYFTWQYLDIRNVIIDQSDSMIFFVSVTNFYLIDENWVSIMFKVDHYALRLQIDCQNMRLLIEKYVDTKEVNFYFVISKWGKFLDISVFNNSISFKEILGIIQQLLSGYLVQV